MSYYISKNQATVHDKSGLPVYGIDKDLVRISNTIIINTFRNLVHFTQISHKNFRLIKMNNDHRTQARKQASKHDPEKEKEVRRWIEAVTGSKFSSSNFQESLKDGVLLCQLANKIKPNSIKNINSGKMPFMCMENIGEFLKAAADLGLSAHDTFMTVDLYEGKNIPLVIMALYSLGSVVQKRPGYKLPCLGLKIADKKEIEFTEKQLRQASNEVGQQFAAASIKNDVGRSISKEVIKVNNTGDSRSFSQQTGGSIKHDTGRSISNEVVKIKPSTSTTYGNKPASSSSSNTGLDDLEKLAALRDKGILTEREFQQKKKQILGL